MTEADETVTVDSSDGSLRLDRWFKRHYPGLGHGQLEKLLRTGRIRVDGKRARSSDRVGPGQAIRIPPHEVGAAAAAVRPQPRPADEAMLQAAILHRDDAVIVLDKPPGLAVQGGTATERHVDGLLDGLRFGNRRAAAPRAPARQGDERHSRHCPHRCCGGVFDPRLSREDDAQDLLGRRRRAAEIGSGPHRPAAREIARPRAANGSGPTPRRAAAPITYYQVVDSAGTQASWLALMPVTGRTHQLRAHCAAIGTPILGDAQIWRGRGPPGRRPRMRRQLHLHARSLSIPHPLGGTLRVTAPLPPHMRRTWEFFGFAGDVGGSFCRTGCDVMKRFYQEGRARASGRRLRRYSRRQTDQDPRQARSARAERGAGGSNSRRMERPSRRGSAGDDAADPSRTTTIDRVATQRDQSSEQTANYAGTDLVCYRATHPPALAARQQAVWQPLIDWAVLRYDAPLVVTSGVIPKSQSAASLRAFAAAVAERDDFALTALHVATAACGSLVIGLALIEGHLDAEGGFRRLATR